ncbi:2-carboxy-D-arabinitol-1-phosphatase [Tripterygium wilfordii]|uniref:2-carboxy-D-arabinitol-1-phosphatase n=1 Tax=Tripterygium wilfordii TaxID=458696 RepID=A0A7J7DZ09_TRIWF|nr:probable 2-carboxy-D-arabinitol-1-phosphatase [Tripterygium wilfordii]KAF5751598.1 2-carboxy-D-arabinitol-1-phosphatase [Tripterygium wilfordii]
MLSTAVTSSLVLYNHNPILRPNFCSFRVRSSSSVQEINESVRSTAEERTLGTGLYASLPFPPIKAAKRVVLVRHGQSTWNEEGRIQGSSDFSILTKKGEAQAETSRFMLLDDSFDVCFSSPLIRSKRTAEIIWSTRKEDIITDSDLREIDLYSFQGLLKHEGKEKFGAAFRQWQVDAANFIIDDHYPVRELWARARSCWNKILAHESRSVLVVAHNAVNQALVATAIGLGTEYFRILLQSNCGVSVLDFTPGAEGQSPDICLNRLNQTPNSPIASGTSGGRKTSKRIILVCHGSTPGDTEASSPDFVDQPMNMLGLIQSQKTAELLLDLKVSSIVSSPKDACVKTAMAISRVQEAADCLGADCVPRYVEMKQMQDLDVEHILRQSRKEAAEVPPLHPKWITGLEDDAISILWNQSGKAWQSISDELSEESEPEKIVVVVGHPAIHIALMGHCLNLTKEWMGSFHLDAGSISVIDFPDARGIIRCINYTAHLGRWSIPITRPTMDDEEF